MLHWGESIHAILGRLEIIRPDIEVLRRTEALSTLNQLATLANRAIGYDINSSLSGNGAVILDVLDAQASSAQDMKMLRYPITQGGRSEGLLPNISKLRRDPIPLDPRLGLTKKLLRLSDIPTGFRESPIYGSSVLATGSLSHFEVDESVSSLEEPMVHLDVVVKERYALNIGYLAERYPSLADNQQRALVALLIQWAKNDCYRPEGITREILFEVSAKSNQLIISNPKGKITKSMVADTLGPVGLRAKISNILESF